MVQVETRRRNLYYLPIRVGTGMKSTAERVTFLDLFYKLLKVRPVNTKARSAQNTRVVS